MKGNELSETVQSALFNVFNEYNTKLKPLIAAYESLTGKFPGQILNEIRASHDHVARCFVSGHSEAERLGEINKAEGHIIRCILDGYKHMILYGYDFVDNFHKEYQDIQLSLVNDGKFLPELQRLEDFAKQQTIEARLKESESFPNKESSYEYYQKAILAYKDIESHIKANSVGLSNVKQFAQVRTKKERRNNWKFAIIGAVIGAVLGVGGSLLASFLYDSLKSQNTCEVVSEGEGFDCYH